MKKSELRQIIREEISYNEATGFAQSMYSMEDDLKRKNPQKWDEWEKESGSLWEELDVSNWEDAFKTDPMACYALKESLEYTMDHI